MQNKRGLLAFRRGSLQGITIEESRLFAENLEAVAWALHHKDPVLIINGDRDWPLERPLTFRQPMGSLPAFYHVRIEFQTFASPLGQRGLASYRGEKAAIGIEYLQTVVLVIGYINDAVFINRDASGPIELPITLTGRAELHQEVAVRGEFLNAVVAPVGHVHIPIVVHRDAPGDVELAVTAAAAAPLRQEFPVFGEHLNPVVPAVHQVEMVIRIEDQPGGTVNFAVARTGRPPFADPVSILGKHGDAVEPLIGHIGVALAVKRNRGGPEEGAINGVGNGVLRVNFFPEVSDPFYAG